MKEVRSNDDEGVDLGVVEAEGAARLRYETFKREPSVAACSGRPRDTGDVVLLDPGLAHAHLVSRNDLTETVSRNELTAILTFFMDNCVVNKFRINFIEPLKM
jgi:hypothetical protein